MSLFQNCGNFFLFLAKYFRNIRKFLLNNLSPLLASKTHSAVPSGKQWDCFHVADIGEDTNPLDIPWDCIPSQPLLLLRKIRQPCTLRLPLQDIRQPCSLLLSLHDIRQPCSLLLSLHDIRQHCSLLLSLHDIRQPCSLLLSLQDIRQPCSLLLSLQDRKSVV